MVSCQTLANLDYGAVNLRSQHELCHTVSRCINILRANLVGVISPVAELFRNGNKALRRGLKIKRGGEDNVGDGVKPVIHNDFQPLD